MVLATIHFTSNSFLGKLTSCTEMGKRQSWAVGQG